MPMRIAINGCGRIGRAVVRSAIERDADLEPGGAYAYAIDLNYGKGCGICAEECPCGAIEMEPEEV
jgi:Pyruvate/2-oxoacid:ferredoxin oxidoreductase delta subunit